MASFINFLYLSNRKVFAHQFPGDQLTLCAIIFSIQRFFLEIWRDHDHSGAPPQSAER